MSPTRERRARKARSEAEAEADVGVMHPLTFRLEGRVASAKNSTTRKQIGSRVLTVKSDAARAWMRQAVAQLEPQRPAHHVPIEAPVRVALLLRGPISHPHAVDGDNALAGVLDALAVGYVRPGESVGKGAAILADDGPRIVRLSSVEWRPAPTWSAEITITPYEGPAA